MAISATTPLNAALARISGELDECSLRVERIVTQSVGQLWTPPPKGGWSVGQCIAHLTRTSEEWVNRLEPAIEDAPVGSPPYKPTLTGRLLAWFLEPPYRIKAKAVPIFTPRQRKPPGPELINEFMAAQQEVQRMLQAAEGKAIDKVILPSPVDARMKYDVYSAFRIIAAHQRRHLWQAERVMKALGKS